MKKITCIVMAGLFCFCYYSIFSQESDQERIAVWKQLSNSPLIKNLPESAIDQSKEVNVLVQGDVSKIKKLIENTGGTYKYSAGDIAAVSISINKLNLIKNNPFVKKIEYQPSVGKQILADSMRVQANVDSIYKGLGILLNGYDGTGVVIGMIDFGIDYDHADFRDSSGNTRIKYIWDTDQAGTPPVGYGYGNECDSTEIALGTCGATKASHGTATSGIACGNGRDSALYRGVAPGVDIIMVDISSGSSTLSDAASYIFKMADSLGKPCVINTSAGFIGGHGVLSGNADGAHDGKDLETQLLVNLLKAKKGRAFAGAAGNDGNLQPFHFGYNVETDSSFTWLMYNSNGVFGLGLFFELWADTNNFKNVQYCLGMDKVSGGYEFRGKTGYHSVTDNLNTNLVETITSKSGNFLAKVNYWMEIIDDKYFMQIYAAIADVDSNQYHFRWMTKGSGSFDVWSYDTLSGYVLNVSEIVPSSEIPSSGTFPEIVRYKAPDTFKSILPGFQCSPDVLTVGVGYNKTPGTVGDIAPRSSKGYNLRNEVKPDVVALAGNIMIPKVGGGYTSQGDYTSFSSPVVAGVAALYFQKYPDASYKDVNNAIRMSAKEDSFTGVTPNPTWGYGKINGYAALTMFKPTLTINSTSTTICNGDSVTLSTTGSTNYWWAKSSAPIDTLVVNQSVKVAPTVTSTYILTGVDTNGFSKKDSVKITVTPFAVFTVSLSGDTVCFGETVSMKASGATFYTWDDANLDSIGSGSELFSAPDSTTSYRVTGWDTNTCAVEKYINITVLDKPTVYVLTSEDTICKGESITLFAGGTDWLWWDDAAWDSIGTGDSIIVKPDSSTMYYISGQDSNGCWDVDSIWIVVHLLPTISGAAFEDTICKGDTVLLAGSGADWLWWFNAAWDTVASNDSAWVGPVSSTSYYLTGVDSNGCWNKDSVWIEINKVNLLLTSSDNNYCPEDTALVVDSVMLSATGGVTYLWKNSNGDTLSTSNSIKVFPQVSTNYYVNAWDAMGCSAYDSIEVGVKARPTLTNVTITQDTVCEGESVTINFSTNAVWNMLFDENFNYLLGTWFPYFVVTPDSSAKYYIIVANIDSCWSIDSLNVTVLPAPVVNLGPDTVCTNCTGIILDAGSGGTSYLWSTGDTTQTVTVKDTGNYSVTVTGTNDCTSSDNININWPTGINMNNQLSENKFSVYPNPYKNSTQINYELVKGGFIEIVVYDILGNKVQTLVKKNQTSGSYSIPFSTKASGRTNGIYIVKFTIDNSEAKVIRLVEVGK